MSLRNLTVTLLLLSAAPALARSDTCPDASDHARLEAFEARIAAAETPEAARQMALDQTRLGHVAVARAARLRPNDPEIAASKAQLDAFEARVRAASTQEQVALEVDRLAQTQALGGGCSYTTAEIVIIVIGFIFGILPGILFLFLFC